MHMKHKNNSSKMFPTLFFTFIALVIACLAAVYAWVLINNYEKGVAEIYAQEQDGYVQLVLDQINLQPENTDEEIIRNILGTLDSSSNRYWTLSHASLRQWWIRIRTLHPNHLPKYYRMGGSHHLP